MTGRLGHLIFYGCILAVVLLAPTIGSIWCIVAEGWVDASDMSTRDAGGELRATDGVALIRTISKLSIDP